MILGDGHPDPLQARRTRRLDQDDVTRLEFVAQQLDRGGGVGHSAGLAVPRAFQSGGIGNRPGRLADGDDACYRQLRRAPSDRLVRRGLVGPQLGHLPQDGDGAATTSASSAAFIDSGLAL